MKSFWGSNTRLKKIGSRLAIFVVLAVIFQNCGKFQSDVEPTSVSTETNKALSVPPPVCQFDGKEIPEGESVKAFLASTVAFGSVCVTEERKCKSGVLSGTFNYASCEPGAPAACLFNGQTIAHFESVSAFQNSTVGFGSSCVEQVRVCHNGELSGSYVYSSCSVGQPAACLFQQNEVAHNSAVLAFQSSTVGYGETCAVESRVCNNGTLSGSFQYGSCSAGAPAVCSFNNKDVAHGAAVNAYSKAQGKFQDGCPEPEPRVCNNGVLSGSAPYATCVVDAPSPCLVNGETMAHGQIGTFYTVPVVSKGTSCVSENRTCNDGALSGSYNFRNCEKSRTYHELMLVTPSEGFFSGGIIADSKYWIGFMNSMCSNYAKGEAYLVLQGRSLHVGALSKEIEFEGPVFDYKGEAIAENKSKFVSGDFLKPLYSSSQSYLNPIASMCQCDIYGQNCTQEVSGPMKWVQVAKSSCDKEYSKSPFLCLKIGEEKGNCRFNGKTIRDGESTLAFFDTVSFDCRSQTRVCNNGVLSGTYLHDACKLNEKDCRFNTKIIKHGESVKAYAYSLTACNRYEMRQCLNGKLTGSYEHDFCEPKK